MLEFLHSEAKASAGDGQSVKARDHRGHTSIVCAIRQHQAMMEHLFRFGAKANMRDYRGCTPLFEAIRQADNDIIKAAAEKRR